MRKVGMETPVGKIDSEDFALDDKFFRVLKRTVATPDGTIREPQLVWDQTGREFAIAIATTEQNKIVFIREPKYGQLDHFLVLPTGGVKKEEAPIDAAAREFLAETGYRAENWKIISNRTIVGEPDKRDGGGHHVVVAKKAIQVAKPEVGSKVELLSVEEAFDEMRIGNIRVDMTMAALGVYLTALSYPTI